MIDLFKVPAVDFFLTQWVYNILRKGLFIDALLLSYLVIIKKTRDGNIGKQWHHHDNAKKSICLWIILSARKDFLSDEW